MSGLKTWLLSPKLARRLGYYGTEDAPIATLGHWCPACRGVHDFAVEVPFRNGARWRFDGNAAAPSFTPSMNISWGPRSDGTTGRCHYYLTGGRIEYQPDCTHELRGQTVDLPDLPPARIVGAEPDAWIWTDPQ